jgi:uncharacterized protein (DUF885 family)
VCFGAGWQVATWRFSSVQARNEAAEAARQAENRRLVAEIAKVTQQAISQIRIENRTIYQRTRREVIRDPVYIDCVVPVDGSRLLNEARRAGNDRLRTDGTVPANADDPDPG